MTKSTMYTRLKLAPQEILVYPAYRYLEGDRLDSENPLIKDLIAQFLPRAQYAISQLLCPYTRDRAFIWTPSQLGKCKRQLAYQMFGIQASNPMKPRGIFTFAKGYCWEAMMAMLFRAAIAEERPNWKFITPFKLEMRTPKGTLLVGGADDYLLTPEGIGRVEYKSQSSFQFDRLQRSHEIENTFGYADQDLLYSAMSAYHFTRPETLPADCSIDRAILGHLLLQGKIDTPYMGGLFVAVRKDTGNMLEIVSEPNADWEVRRLALFEKADELHSIYEQFKDKPKDGIALIPRIDPSGIDKLSKLYRLDVRCNYCDYLNLCIPLMNDEEGAIRMPKVRSKNIVWVLNPRAYDTEKGWNL